MRIRGGELEDRHDPTFVRGRNHIDDVPDGKCASTSSFVGECGGEECARNRVTFDVPGEFRGRRPKPVFLSDLNGRGGSNKNVRVAPQSSEKKAIEDSKKEARQDDQMAREEENARKKQRELETRKWDRTHKRNDKIWRKRSSNSRNNRSDWWRRNRNNHNNHNNLWKRHNSNQNNQNNWMEEAQ